MSRRGFLAGVGTTAMGTLLRPIMAYAQLGIAPQRLLFIHRSDGTTLGTANDARWWPTGGTTGWTASPLLSSFTDGKIASLQNNMVVLRGISCPRNMNWLGDKHGAGFLGMITPPVKDQGPTTWPKLPTYQPSYQLDPNSKSITASDESIDQLFLRQIPALKGSPCPVPSAQLTASAESADRMTSIPFGGSCVRVTSYARPAAGGPMTQGATVVPVPIALYPEASPMTAFQNYFGSGLMGMTPAQIAQAAAENKSVLDFAAKGLTGLQARIPKSQMSKVATGLDAIRQLEMNLTSSASMAGSCAPPMFAGAPLSTSTSQVDSQTYPVWKQQKEIIKTMFQCDLTRVITFTFGYGNSSIHFQNVLKDPELAGKYTDTKGAPINNSSGVHDISHNQGGNPDSAQYIIDKYYCDRTAELLAEMAATPDIGGGSLLDNTLVVFWNECSNGNAHGAVDMPILLFGGKFLKMKGGSYVQFGSAQTNQVPNGTYALPKPPYMSDFWVTTAQAWGYTALTTYGDPSWNTGMLSGIYG
jgi:hypothetical protein